MTGRELARALRWYGGHVVCSFVFSALIFCALVVGALCFAAAR